jgi:hypothetical protein
MKIKQAVMVVGLMACAAFPVASSAQTVTPGGFKSVQASITEYVVRDGVISISINASFDMSCLPAGSLGRYAPLILKTDAKFEEVKEALQMAYLAKKQVRLHSESCVELAPGFNYPRIWGIDVTNAVAAD